MGGSGDGDEAPMVQPVVIRADQHEVEQLREAAVLPVPDVMGVQTASRPTPGDHSAAVAVLECTTKPAADLAGLPAGTDDLAVPFEPHLAGGIAHQAPAFALRTQRTQMQRRGTALDVEMHHHGGALPVWPAGHLAIPTGLDQTHERLDGA